MKQLFQEALHGFMCGTVIMTCWIASFYMGAHW